VGNSLENLAGGEFLRRSSGTPPAKPPRNSPEKEGEKKAADEWEEKIFGRGGKGKIWNH
jgi:hypothetical protein